MKREITIEKTIVDAVTIDVDFENSWAVPARVDHLVIPCTSRGRWSGPPVAVDAANGYDAALRAAERTLRGEPYGFKVEEGATLPPRVYVIALSVLQTDRQRGRLMGSYYNLSAKGRRSAIPGYANPGDYPSAPQEWRVR